MNCVYLDLKKAFDKVPHKNLLWKLENFGGLKGALLKWMTDFLTDREMRTVIRGSKSRWREVTNKRSSTGLSAGASHVGDIYK